MRGWRFLVKRLLHGLFLLWAVSLFSFVFIEVAPGDFTSEMRLNPQISAETIQALRQQYGLDQPLPIRYGRWVASVLRGEFGYSFAYHQPVAPLLWARGINTLVLSSSALLLTWLVAVPIGVWVGARTETKVDRIVSAGTVALYSLPDLVIALVLSLLAVRTGWFAIGGIESIGAQELPFAERLQDVYRHFSLPILALTSANAPLVLRHVRAAVSEAMKSPFVTSLRAHGVSERRILWAHAVPLAANPLVSLLGLSFGTLLSGSMVVELVMAWPGLGPLLLDAAFSRDIYVLIGVVMLSAALLVLGNLLADGLLLLLDPRVRREDNA